ncbi:MAG: hypothetical protein PHQ74_05655 [Crocinitomicaceae bacterium]|nr:hypothetical protein [Crocinitomicaceae bacterium]
MVGSEMNVNTIFAFDNVNLKTYRFLLTNASPFYTMTVLNNTTTFATPYPVVKGLSVTDAGLLTFVAQNGEMQTTTTSVLSGTTVAWVPRSILRSVGINDLHAVTTASGVAAGNNGLLAQFNGTYWYTYKTSTTNNLHAVKSISATNLVVAGAKGHLFSYEIGVNYLTTKAILPKSALLTNGQQANQFIASDLMDVVVSANAIYSVGKNGVILYGENLFDAPFRFKTNYAGVDFNSVYAISPQNVLVAGSFSKLYRFQGVSGTEIKQVFGNKLNDVHFASANVGTIGGDNFFVRQTLDGGNTWKAVLSTSNTAHLTKNIKRVWTWNNGYAILGGESYFTSVYQQLPGTITSTYSVQDIQFPKSSPLNGYITHNGNLVRLILTPHLIAGYTLAPTFLSATFGGNIQAIHVFQNKTVMAVGASNLIKYYKPTTNSWTSYTSGAVAGGDYRDVFFHDDKVGYVVGTNGVMLRSQNAVINSAQEITAISWGSKDINTPDQIISSSSQVGVISAIAFGSRYDGVMGGRYSAANPTLGNTCYVRKINDEAGDFSSKFYYDRLGRLVVSQNSRQKTENKFSYTLYDVLGRVTEAGEKDENASLKFNSVFGTLVNQQYIPTVIDDMKLSNWLVNSGGKRREVTRSYYDQTVIGGTPMTWNPQTQRKRIVHVTYEEVYDNNDETFDHATHYNYDIHGNVKTLLQENRKMVVEDPEMDGQEIKRMDYSFDLVSGNVNRVSYQHGKADQFHHVYSYDADNRIREVFTTETTPLTSDQYGRASLKGEPALTPYWHKDATYSYYQHGPLARTELGGQNVQGIDYIYTIQGWLKGVNSTDLSTERSYKKDGVQTEFAKDVYSYGLHYFGKDYFPINTNYQSTPRMPFAAQPLESFLNQNSSDLYNGNIARMVTTITNPTTRSALVLGNAYRYDQLNRIKYSMSNVDAYDKAKYEWQPAGNAMYDNSFVYDANGNILNQSRYDENQEQVDDLHYQYESGRNRLTSVEDQSVGFSKFSDDIDYSEYQYDPEGRLISDSQENIEDIQWRVDGKVKVILRGGSIPNQKNIIFDYDALGNRIAKHIFDDQFNLEKSTYYVLDATGNVMATYDKEIDYTNSEVYLKLKDRSIYGSTRVGVRSTDIDMLALHNPNYSMKSVKYEIGKRTYELSNHLGNVLSVISDKPIPSFEYEELVGMLADVRVAQDYSPFGVTLSGRSFEVDGGYRYGFNSMEKDDEVKGRGNSHTTFFRQYDSRLSRWLSVDPKVKELPWQSPYCALDNNPIIFVDQLGDKIIYVGDKKFRKEMKAHIKTIKASVDPKTRSMIEKLEKDKNRTLRINDVSDSGEFGFHMPNNKSVSNIGIASAEQLESIVVPGQNKITYDDGTETYELIQNNTLYTVANEMSHAIDWYNNEVDVTSDYYDEYTNARGTGLNWSEKKSNMFENKVREAQGDDLKLEDSHWGAVYSSPKSAKNRVDLSKEKNTKIRNEGLEKLNKEDVSE